MIGMPRRFVPVDAEAVVRARGLADMKQERLAAKAGVSQSALSRIEAGLAKRAETDTLTRLADALEVPFASLAGDDLDPADDPDIVQVRIYEGATVSGGQPFEMGHYAGSYRVSSPEERGHIFLLFKVSGDCMAPRIEAGDFVVVDITRANDWRDGDVVAVMHEGAQLVKRVEMLASWPAEQAILVADDGSTRLVPDGDTRIIGVVVEIRKKP